MKKQSVSEAIILRERAEGIIKKRRLKPGTELSEVEVLKLIHELEVHQIELEMQNEEILLSKEKADATAGKFTELYYFAPIGYFTLSKEGIIVEMNLCGSQMLGKERVSLKNRRFGIYISRMAKPTFNNFLSNVF